MYNYVTSALVSPHFDHAQKFPVLVAMCVHVTILIQRIQCFVKHPVGAILSLLYCIKFLY